MTVDSIERIENGPQHELYSVHRSNLVRQIELSGVTFDPDTMVRLLFHGTSEEAMLRIINSSQAGFLPLLAGTNVGAMWGNGTYFARDAKYSHSYACTLVSGKKQMLVAEVVVGRWAQGSADMKTCPLLPGQQYQCYNSLCDNVSDPSIFVVQHTSQAYPAYVITYH